ncbi:DMT family transporter [Antribacter gilvus]|uniref:DMT family transporter n=1 Tax=Antribacter gilvus TaxID=2304675 RepID=UPI000F791DF4|nr:DMT family transporter [Antribacter gilvus]
MPRHFTARARTSAGARTSARAGLLQVCAAGVLWGTGGLAVQLVREHVPLSVLTISAYRTLVAAVVLVVAVAATRRWTATVRVARAHPFAVVVVGVGTAAYQALYLGAVVSAGVSVATVVSLGVAPVLLTVAEAVRGRRSGPRPGAAQLWAVGLAVLGLALVATSDVGPAAPRPLLGLGLALASGTVYAVTVSVAGRLARSGDPLLVTTATTAAGAVVAVPLVAAVDLAGMLAAPTTLPGAAGLVYLGVFTMALAYALFNAGLRTTPGSAAAVATLLEPVTAAIAAALVLGERLTVAGIAGTVVILGAIALLSAAPREPVPAP